MCPQDVRRTRDRAGTDDPIPRPFPRILMDLDRLGWRGGTEVLEALSARGEAVGRVAVEHRGGYLVYSEAGEVLAEVSGRIRHEARLGGTAGLPAVGDWVAIRPRPGEDRATIR